METQIYREPDRDLAAALTWLEPSQDAGPRHEVFGRRTMTDGRRHATQQGRRLRRYSDGAFDRAIQRFCSRFLRRSWRAPAFNMADWLSALALTESPMTATAGAA